MCSRAHAGFCSGQKSFDTAIQNLINHGAADEPSGEILAAAIALRDSSGRDRLQALRHIAGTWNVARQEQVSGKWKNRSLSTLAKDTEAAVCDAAFRWELHRVAELTDQPDLAIHDSGFISGVPPKNTWICGASTHVAKKAELCVVDEHVSAHVLGGDRLSLDVANAISQDDVKH